MFPNIKKSPLLSLIFAKMKEKKDKFRKTWGFIFRDFAENHIER